MEVQHTAENCVPGKPFQKGSDPRRNTRGRPKTFDAFRELCQKICHENITLGGEELTRLEGILRDWAASKDAQKQIALIHYGFGKPVDKIELDELKPKTTLILKYAHEMPGYVPPPPPIIALDGCFRESSRTTSRMAKELAGPCYLTPTSGQAARIKTTPCATLRVALTH